MLGPMLVEWYYDKGIPGTEGYYVSPMMKNLVVDGGRENILALVPGMTGVDAASSTPYLMLGASSTAAAYTQEQLVYEFNNNTNRISPTNISDATLTRADITLDEVEEGGVTYRMVMTMKFALSATNNLDGQTFQEAGLNCVQATPGSPTTLLGTMLNRIVISPSLTKTAGIPSNLYMQCRF